MEDVDLNNMVCAKSFDAFEDASSYARKLARDHQSHTAILREGNGWVVHVSQFIAAVKNVKDWGYIDHSDGVIEREISDIKAEISEEISDSQVDYERSDETGWFYGDE